MQRVEKTVFISYRRTNRSWAPAIYQNLTQYGYDAFIDYTGIGPGDFETAILENIRARAHFLVILTPSALERCGEPGDWLRREIEVAIESQRNIVPLMLEGFDFGTPTISGQLTGSLSPLRHYNALSVPADYFMEAMGRLRDRFLNVALDAVPQPASLPARQAAAEQKKEAAAAPQVAEEELTAQQWFERGFNAVDLDERIRFYSNAIRLKPDFAEAYNNRGNARSDKGDLEGAIEDFSQAIRFDPGYAEAFSNRGRARSDKGDLDGAIEDYSQAIRLDGTDPDALNNRGDVRRTKGDLDGAIQDYSQAIRIKPDKASVFYNRAKVRRTKGDLDGAIEDYSYAIRLKPDYVAAFYNRSRARRDIGDLAGASEDYRQAFRLDPENKAMRAAGS